MADDKERLDALEKAKELEKEHVPTKKELEEENEELEKEENDLKHMMTPLKKLEGVDYKEKKKK